MALCMSVNPGWGNQTLIPGVASRSCRGSAQRLPDQVALEVDGGVHDADRRACVEAGANLLVAGSAVFGSADPAAAYQSIVAAAGPAERPPRAASTPIRR